MLLLAPADDDIVTTVCFVIFHLSFFAIYLKVCAAAAQQSYWFAATVIVNKCNKNWTRLTWSGESRSRECCMLATAVQTHSMQYLQVLPSDEINACCGFENWSRNIIDGSCVIEHPLSFFTAVVRLPIRHILTAFA